MFTGDTPILVDGMEGYVFTGSEPGSFCFVPVECVVMGTGGDVTFDAARYVLSSWHERNAAFNTQADGARLFPRENGYLGEWADTPAAAYVQRLQRTYALREA